MKKVLIVDDDSRNVFALTAVLRAKKYDCVTASIMADAFVMLEKDATIGILLLDMMMPDIDGYQAMNILRNSDKFRSLPIVAVTAQAMKGDRERCLEAGADAYVSKPIDADQLIKVINTLLQKND
jgi:two-component system cell cycle response regulator DivK